MLRMAQVIAKQGVPTEMLQMSSDVLLSTSKSCIHTTGFRTGEPSYIHAGCTPNTILQILWRKTATDRKPQAMDASI